MPPVTALEHYLQLLAAIESVAAELKTPVVIEGYEPPADYRLQQFMNRRIRFVWEQKNLCLMADTVEPEAAII